MKKRCILKGLLTLAVALTLMMALAVAAHAASVTYVDENGGAQSVDATALTGNETLLQPGAYVVNGSISYDHYLYMNGDVTIILADGGEMKILNDFGAAEGTIWGAQNDSTNPIYNLTIYGQSGQTGKITLDSKNSTCCYVKNLYVYGGEITSTGSDFTGSESAVLKNAKVTIDTTHNQGSFGGLKSTTVYSGTLNAPINSYIVDINGGTVNAEYINTQGNDPSQSVNISGGTVVIASTDKNPFGHAIMTYGSATISGGNVTISATDGSGIWTEYGNITISGGQVTITSSASGDDDAGILTKYGKITLDLSKNSDFVKVSKYSAGGSVEIPVGHELTDGATTYGGTLHPDEVARIRGLKLMTLNGYPHIHKFTYAADGATLTATCGETLTACPLSGSNYQAKLTVVKPTLTTYGGAGSAEATLSGDTDVLGMPPIAYAKDGATLDAPPTDAGSYTASIALGGATASVAYEIAPAAVTIAALPEASAITLGQALSQSALTSGAAKSGDTEVPGSFAWAAPDTVPALSDSETTEFDAVFTPSDTNYAKTPCKVKLTVNKPFPKVNPPYAIEGLKYTGEAQELLTAGSAEGGEMQYALGDASGATEAFKAGVPKGADQGTYYAWWRVVGDETHADIAPDVFKVTIGEPDPEPEPQPQPEPQPDLETYITPLSADSVEVGETIYLDVHVSIPGMKKISLKWKISDSTVAYINKGALEGKKAGSVLVTVTVLNYDSVVAILSRRFTVVDTLPTGIRFAEDTPTQVYKDKTVDLSRYMRVEPENWTKYKKKITWKCSKPKVAKVDKYGVVTGKKAGTAEITVKIILSSRVVYAQATLPITVVDADKTTPTSFTLSRLSTKPLGVGIDAKEQIEVQYEPAWAKPRKTKWVSSDKDVVSVDPKGVLTGKKAGVATVTLTADGISRSIDVEVYDYNEPTEMRFADDTPTRIGIHSTYDLASYLRFAPDTASRKVKWESSDRKVASVDVNGKITAWAAGTATITATSKYNSKTKGWKMSASVDITVYDVEAVKLYGPESVIKGRSVTVTAIIEPAGIMPKYYKWTVDDKTVASVKNGVVTGRKAGKVRVTLTVEKKISGSIDIVVIDDSIPTEMYFREDAPTAVGTKNTIDLADYLCFAPETADRSVQWRTSNSTVASIGSKSGELKAKSKTGTITVTATSLADKNLTASLDITIFGVNNILLSGPESIRVGESASIVPTYEPAGAAPDKTQWTSSDKKVANVTRNGLVTGLKPGTATITHTADGVGQSIVIEVK